MYRSWWVTYLSSAKSDDVAFDNNNDDNNNNNNNLYIKVRSGDRWPARDWSKPPSVNRQRHIRGRRLNDDVVLRRLFTLHYLAPSSLFQPHLIRLKNSPLAKASRHRAGWQITGRCLLTRSLRDTILHLGSDIYDLNRDKGEGWSARRHLTCALAYLLIDLSK